MRRIKKGTKGRQTSQVRKFVGEGLDGFVVPKAPPDKGSGQDKPPSPSRPTSR